MRPHAAALKALLNEPAAAGHARLRRRPGREADRRGRVQDRLRLGSSISAMRLAMPDMDLLTFPEMPDAVETLIAAAPGCCGWPTAIPATAMRSRAEDDPRLCPRGAAAVLIEDKHWPRPLGHGGAKLVVEREAARLRCRAAVAGVRGRRASCCLRAPMRGRRAGSRRRWPGSRLSWPRAPTSSSWTCRRSEEEMRASVEACQGKPAIAVTSPAGKHFMPADAGLARIGIRMVPSRRISGRYRACGAGRAGRAARAGRVRRWRVRRNWRRRSGRRTIRRRWHAARAWGVMARPGSAQRPGETEFVSVRVDHLEKAFAQAASRGGVSGRMPFSTARACSASTSDTWKITRPHHVHCRCSGWVIRLR